MKTFQGLSKDEVLQSYQKYGDNKITEQKGESFWDKLKGNFDDPIIKILCVALLINVVFAFMGKAEWYETVGIALAVILATGISTYSEYQNENAFQKLQAEASLIKCKVYRSGTITEIPIDDIVRGDLIVLQSGDKIPVDGVVIDGNLKVDQSVLNGEAKEATKVATSLDAFDYPETMDMLDESKVFRGSVVCDGNAVICATVIGDKSVYGEIAKELQSDDDRDTPLKLKLSQLANQISKFGYCGGVAIAIAFMIERAFISGVITDGLTFFMSLIDAIMLAVIIIVMAVPEGLPLMIAIVSAQNMGKMLKDNVLVRKISGIETAGSLNILFSDKTGTITKGQLEVVDFINGEVKEYDNFQKVPEQLSKLVVLSTHYNTGSVLSDGKAVGGNLTERALLNYTKLNTVPQVITGDGVPFNSTNKYSMQEVVGDYNLVLVKGAPEKLIDKCTLCYNEYGDKVEFNQKEALNTKIDELAKRAIRVLALACYEGTVQDSLPDNLTLIGVVGIRDEVRPEAITAIKQVNEAGVQVVMITGDRLDTAKAIAIEAGLVTSEDDIILTSNQLSGMDDDLIKKMLPNLKVIARALPSDKSRLVRLAQELNLVVGMTGDGVNDSPALKKADVGFAMGSGTEVAKEASEIVILDDNFLSIEKAILYGRTIFNSIRKFIIFQLTINVAAVMISFVCPLLGMENPLSITQILWVNLVMDTLAALAFGGEPALQRYMQEQPKRRDEHILNQYMYSEIGTGAIWTFLMSLVFLLTTVPSDFFRPDNKYLMTGYFAFFIFIAVFNAFNARTEQMNLFDNITKNTGFLKVMGLIAVVQVIMVYIGDVILRCYGLNFNEWLFVLVMAFSIIPIDLIRKKILG